MNYNIKTILIEEKEYTILIGKNAHGNEEIIRMSHPESIWMHLNGISSAHVILDSKGDLIPKRYINQVSGLLFQHKTNVPRNTKVIYTQVKNVKLTKTPGSVTTKNTRFI